MRSQKRCVPRRNKLISSYKLLWFRLMNDNLALALVVVVAMRLDQSTVVAKRIRTLCYFIKKEQMRVTQPNKSGKQLYLYLKYNMYKWYCSFLTLTSFFRILGMQINQIYSGQTPDTLP